MELGGWVCHGVFEIFSDWTRVGVFFLVGGGGWTGNETKKTPFFKSRRIVHKSVLSSRHIKCTVDPTS